MFVCTPGKDVLMSALCDGTDNCGGGNDETTALCESQLQTSLSLSLSYCFSLCSTDKCRLPYYGGCPYTRECITSEFDVNCGACLSGFIPDPNNNTNCIGKWIRSSANFQAFVIS